MKRKKKKKKDNHLQSHAKKQKEQQAFNWRKGSVPLHSTVIVPLLVLALCASTLALCEVIKTFLDNCCFLSAPVSYSSAAFFSDCLTPLVAEGFSAPFFFFFFMSNFFVLSQFHSQHWIKDQRNVCARVSVILHVISFFGTITSCVIYFGVLFYCFFNSGYRAAPQ